MIKGASDRIMAMALVNTGHMLAGAVLVILYPLPAPKAWGFLVASTVIHWFYYGFLLAAYRIGDFSHAYPIARGVAPVLVALGALFFAAEMPTVQGWLAIIMISTAIGAQSLAGGHMAFNAAAVLFALLTGLMIAAYTIVDGLGVRASQNVLGYIGWLFLLEGIASVALLTWRRRRLRHYALRKYLTGLTGGLISTLAYGLAIYAMSLTNLGSVSAIRESSVIVAALIGVVWFGERPWLARVASAIVVVVGIFLLGAA